MVVIGRAGIDYPDGCHYTLNGVADNVLTKRIVDAGQPILLRQGVYTFADTLALPSNAVLTAEGSNAVTIQMEKGKNKTILTNADTTYGNSNILVRGLTLDQQGENQRLGGGIVLTGINDSTFEDVIIAKSYNFNFISFLIPGSNLSGSVTFRNGSEIVGGTLNCKFLTEILPGDIIKSAAGKFARVTKVVSDVSLRIDRAWGYNSELEVTAKRVPGNMRNKIVNCKFKGTTNLADNVGLGGWTDSQVLYSDSSYSRGYGFGPDHAHNMTFMGNTCHNNVNAGIGMETVSHSSVIGNELYDNAAGVYLLSGAFRNIIQGNHAYRNTYGIHVSYNSASFPRPNDNQIIGNHLSFNTVHGARIGGGDRTIFAHNHCYNNDQSGVVTASDLSVAPSRTMIIGNHCFDDQTVKTQDRGIHISAGIDTLVTNNISRDADHNTAGITDGGTNTTMPAGTNIT